MDQLTRSLVKRRASHRCEYCQLTESQSPIAKLQIEHIVPRKHGGSDELANLASACIGCNLHKGANLCGIDPETIQVTELYNSRAQRWEEHFRWDGGIITGLSAVGRTTIRVLETNSTDRLLARLANLNQP